MLPISPAGHLFLYRSSTIPVDRGNLSLTAMLLIGRALSAECPSPVTFASASGMAALILNQVLFFCTAFHAMMFAVLFIR